MPLAEQPSRNGTHSPASSKANPGRAAQFREDARLGRVVRELIESLPPGTGEFNLTVADPEPDTWTDNGPEIRSSSPGIEACVRCHGGAVHLADPDGGAESVADLLERLGQMAVHLKTEEPEYEDEDDDEGMETPF